MREAVSRPLDCTRSTRSEALETSASGLSDARVLNRRRQQRGRKIEKQASSDSRNPASLRGRQPTGNRTTETRREWSHLHETCFQLHPKAATALVHKTLRNREGPTVRIATVVWRAPILRWRHVRNANTKYQHRSPMTRHPQLCRQPHLTARTMIMLAKRCKGAK
jgi:hypothetical protein